MRTFAEKRKPPPQSNQTATRGWALFIPGHGLNSTLRPTRAAGNAAQRPVSASDGDAGGGLTSTSIARGGHDFSRAPIHAATPVAVPHGGGEWKSSWQATVGGRLLSAMQPRVGDAAKPGCREQVEPTAAGVFGRLSTHLAASPTPDQAKSSVNSPVPGEDVTQSPGKAGGPAKPAPPDAGAGPTDAPAKSKAKLKSGPTYTPSGAIKATKSGGTKTASFKLSAEFENDAANGFAPSSGEVRQYIKWTKAADIPNHAGFTPKANYSANTWYEDRDGVGKRYGHRSGAYSECTSINQYEDKKGKQDCANGEVFSGQDDPMDGSGAKTGEWKFELRAVDTSDGGKEIGTPASVTVDWNV